VSEPVFDIVVVLRALSAVNPDGHTGCIELWRKSADEIESLRSRLAAAEGRLVRIRGIAAEPRPINLTIRLANIVAIIDAPDGFSPMAAREGE
jgi:hypothetical protein